MTHAAPPGKGGSDRSAWHAQAEPLARWAMGALVNRTDRCGKHYTDREAGDVRRCADPADEAKARDGFLEPSRLVRHFRAERTEDVVGSYSYGRDGRGRWVCVDIDAHTPGDDPDRNRRFALYLSGVCRDLGLSALLYESDGKGGFHLWILFNRPVPATVLRAFGLWLVHDHAEHGFEKPPEVFPKNDGDTSWGHWVRLPGRHPKRNCWPVVWNPAAGEWVGGEAAVGRVLALVPGDPDLIPPAAAPPTVTGRDPAEPRPAKPAPPGGSDLPPWEDFNRRAGVDGVAELLVRHGWTPERRDRRDGAVNFIRPGKGARDAQGGNLLEVTGVPVFYCFTSEAPPLEPDRGYAAAALVALLDHGGDFAASARALSARGYGSRPRPPAAAPPDRPGFVVGDLSLQPGPGRVTGSGKLVVPLAVLRGGRAIDTVTLTSVPSGRLAAVKLIAGHGPEGADRDAVNRVVGEVLAAAAERAAGQAAAPDGLTVRDVVRAYAAERLDLRNRTEKGGLWSEAMGRELSRPEVLAFTPTPLVDAAAAAADAPRDRRGLLLAVRAELDVFFADQQQTLGPRPAGEAASAARQFLAAVRRLWNAPRVGKLAEDSAGVLRPVPGSLASRARELTRDFERMAPGPWLQIAVPYLAHWRVVKSDAGGVTRRLGFYYEVGDQVGVTLPGVHSQDDLRELGVKFGVIDPGDGPRARGRDETGRTRRERIAVLTLDLSEDLLADPSDGPDDDPDPGQ